MKQSRLGWAAILLATSLAVSSAHEITESDFDPEKLQRLKTLLADDPTNSIKYNERHSNPEFGGNPETYQCGQFARDVQWNLYKAGFSTNRVSASYKRGKEAISHVFLQTKLKDKSGQDRTVYIEAQTDKIHTTPENLVDGLGHGKPQDFHYNDNPDGPVGVAITASPRVNVKAENFKLKITTYKAGVSSSTVGNQRFNIKITNPDGTTTEINDRQTGADGTIELTIPNGTQGKAQALGKDIKVEVTVPGTDAKRTANLRVLLMSAVTPNRPDNEGYVTFDRAPTNDLLFSRIAVQTQDQCVATNYYFSQISQAIIESCPLGGAPDELVARPPTGTPSQPVSTPGPESVPDCGGPDAPLVTMTPRDVPVSPPSAGVPESPPSKAPPSTPAPPSITVTEAPPPASGEVPDLGLVKAEESVVKLALTGGSTGVPYEGATVKLLQQEPPLRLADGTALESAMTSTNAYRKRTVTAGNSAKDGTVELASAGTASTPESEKSKVESKGELRIDQSKKARLVVTMSADKAVRVGSGNKIRLPGSLNRPGFDLCVSRAFQIGQQAIFVTSLADARAEDFKRAAADTAGVSSVEEDPCRKKELNAE